MSTPFPALDDLTRGGPGLQYAGEPTPAEVPQGSSVRGATVVGRLHTRPAPKTVNVIVSSNDRQHSFPVDFSRLTPQTTAAALRDSRGHIADPNNIALATFHAIGREQQEHPVQPAIVAPSVTTSRGRELPAVGTPESSIGTLAPIVAAPPQSPLRQRPLVTAVFDLPGFGDHEVNYTDVQRSGDVILLVRDSSDPRVGKFPQVSAAQIGLRVENLGIFLVEVSDKRFTILGSLEVALLLVVKSDTINNYERSAGGLSAMLDRIPYQVEGDGHDGQVGSHPGGTDSALAREFGFTDHDEAPGA